MSHSTLAQCSFGSNSIFHWSLSPYASSWDFNTHSYNLTVCPETCTLIDTIRGRHLSFKPKPAGPQYIIQYSSLVVQQQLCIKWQLTFSSSSQLGSDDACRSESHQALTLRNIKCISRRLEMGLASVVSDEAQWKLLPRPRLENLWCQ